MTETLESKPKVVGIKGGWAAVGSDWAVFAESKQEALAKWRDALARHGVMQAREESAAPAQGGQNDVAMAG